ncbi:hypothetical protein [Cupriavidus alkaliphilus]|uniref:Uncharacterized protein n=1 Tax=Cupriavidus alkaliphilus TaxID=942866 RepID=A0A7W4VD55_9BURK|nr:hypothetical protein [Cupriavidus alkaliphilus]MBB3009439.1 hypothetical protein [Cupriavidus alkaliphilus]PVY69373.1 hypothetical protein C7414_11852 [Cupriavidus alkaliphilus]
MIEMSCTTSTEIKPHSDFDLHDFVFEVEGVSGHDPERAMWGEAIQY